MNIQISTDPVIIIRGQIDAVHKAMSGARCTAIETEISNSLPHLWRKLEDTKPTSLEGAAILIEEADDYTGDLAYGLTLSGGVFDLGNFLVEVAARVRAGSHTQSDVRALVFWAAVTRPHLPANHPFPRLLTNAADYLASRAAH